MTTDRRCVLFTKPARPGLVKTRLHSVLSPQEAAALHQAFLDDLVPRLASGRFELTIAWAVEEGEPLPQAIPTGSEVPGMRQRGGDLGERLFHGLRAAGESPEAFVAAVGGDHPELMAATVEEAFERLERGADIVLGPAADGGYYLIALRAGDLSPRIFQEIDWSSSSVLESTLERCRELSLLVEHLPTGHDVDLPEDLERLTRTLARNGDCCPNTERLLRRWGRIR